MSIWIQYLFRYKLISPRAWLGLRYGVEEAIKSADVILVLDCDVPWINTQCKPNTDAKIYHVDVDPLKQQMPVFYLNALARYKADSYLAVTQLTAYINCTEHLKTKVSSHEFVARWTKLQGSYKQKLQAISDLAKPADDGTFATSYLISRVRHFCPADTIWAIEAVTQTPFVADQLQVKYPGSWLNCGGGGLGWSGGGKSSTKTEHVSRKLMSQRCSRYQTCYRQSRRKEVCLPNSGRWHIPFQCSWQCLLDSKAIQYPHSNDRP